MSLWADAGESGAKFGTSRKGPGHVDAVERLKDWTRARFNLEESDLVMVSENPCSAPGFPPEETDVTFWTSDATRHHFKFFKRVEEVAEDDLPPAWLRDALAASEGAYCECC